MGGGGSEVWIPNNHKHGAENKRGLALGRRRRQAAKQEKKEKKTMGLKIEFIMLRQGIQCSRSSTRWQG